MERRPYEREPVLTAQHRRRQDATVRALERAVAEAEAYLAEHPDRIEPRALCPCRVPRKECRCEMQRAT